LVKIRRFAELTGSPRFADLRGGPRSAELRGGLRFAESRGGSRFEGKMVRGSKVRWSCVCREGRVKADFLGVGRRVRG
jgi:hypothetical protein